MAWTFYGSPGPCCVCVSGSIRVCWGFPHRDKPSCHQHCRWASTPCRFRAPRCPDGWQRLLSSPGPGAKSFSSLKRPWRWRCHLCRIQTGAKAFLYSSARAHKWLKLQSDHNIFVLCCARRSASSCLISAFTRTCYIPFFSSNFLRKWKSNSFFLLEKKNCLALVILCQSVLSLGYSLFSLHHLCLSLRKYFRRVIKYTNQSEIQFLQKPNKVTNRSLQHVTQPIFSPTNKFHAAAGGLITLASKSPDHQSSSQPKRSSKPWR